VGLDVEQLLFKRVERVASDAGLSGARGAGQQRILRRVAVHHRFERGGQPVHFIVPVDDLPWNEVVLKDPGVLNHIPPVLSGVT
jgi:hypothetical protein